MVSQRNSTERPQVRTLDSDSVHHLDSELPSVTLSPATSAEQCGVYSEPTITDGAQVPWDGVRQCTSHLLPPPCHSFLSLFQNRIQHLTPPAGMANMKNAQGRSVGQDVRIGTLAYCWRECRGAAPRGETLWQGGPQNVKHRINL